jgi:uncharacterized protein YuzE
MKVTYDSDADAAYIRIMDADHSHVAESEEMKPGVVVDYDAEGRIVGIEILSVSRNYPQAVVTDLERQAMA